MAIGELPQDAQEQLKRAAQVGSAGSIERQVAINEAYERIELRYPHLFKRRTYGMKIMLNNVRLAFAQQLFEAGTINGEGEPAYSSTFIIDGADNKTLKLVNDAIDAVAKEKWGAKAEGIVKQLRAAGKVCLQDGDAKAQYDGFAGNWFVPARSQARPLVIDRDKSPLTKADGKPYSGCYVAASLEVWAQDNGFGKRVNAQLRGVQFVRDGESFGGGGRPAGADEFADLGEGADADSELA